MLELLKVSYLWDIVKGCGPGDLCRPTVISCPPNDPPEPCLPDEIGCLPNDFQCGPDEDPE